MAFLHGSETIELKNGPKIIRAVKSAIIALPGIAPKGDKNKLILVQSPKDAEQFGEQIPGFTIPQAIAAIQAQGNATIYVVNVFDNASHITAVTAETVTVVNRKAKTAFAPVGSTAPVVTNSAGSTTYVAGTDYKIDDFGNITVLAAIGTIAENATLKVTYGKLDIAAITSSVLIGTNSGGVRTGTKCFLDAYNQLGARPKIFIAPGFSSINAVAAELTVLADYYKGMALIDAPTGTTVAAAITARGPAGTINLNTANGRTILLVPGNLKAYDPATDSTVNRPFSQFYAGIISVTDSENGFWHSPSNRQIKGVLGSEYAVTAEINNPNTEANALNEIGICTIFNSGTSGIRTWGNRTAKFPSSSNPDVFIPIRRTMDIINESIELSMLDFLPGPITSGIIDAVRASVQSYINSLIVRGALLVGSEITFDPLLNSDSQIAAGQLVFTTSMMAPPPFERATFNSYIDTTLLKTIGQPIV